MKKQMYLELQARFEEVQIWNRRLQKQLGIVPMTVQEKYENIKNNKNKKRLRS